MLWVVIMPQAELSPSSRAVPRDSDRRRQLMLEAFADVEQGHLVDHRDVVAWADSLGDEQPLPLPR